MGLTRKGYIVLAGVVALVVLIIGWLLLVATPPLPLDSEYRTYSTTDRNLIESAAIGDHIRFTVEITTRQIVANSKEIVIPFPAIASNTITGAGKGPVGLILQIPSQNPRHLTFAAGKAIVFGKVTNRTSRLDPTPRGGPGLGDPSVTVAPKSLDCIVVEVEQIR